MRPTVWLFFFLTVAALAGCDPEPPPTPPSAPLDVLNGDGLLALRGEGWERSDSFVQGRGIINEAYARRRVEDADFTVQARLAMQRVDTSTALFLFFGNHFGFDGSGDGDSTKKGHLFFYSPRLGKPRYFEPARRYIEPGRPFDFSVRRRDTLFAFYINDSLVASVPLGDLEEPAAGFVGFRPWKNVLRIYRWTIEGRLSTLPPPEGVVFGKGENGYVCFRIPAIVRTAGGELLAFAEARRDDCYTDRGDIDLVLKRSPDGGRSWGPLEVVWDDGLNTCASPVPIVEEETGEILLLACNNAATDAPGGLEEGRAQDRRRVYCLRSTDDGRSWAAPREITDAVKPDNWFWYGTGPGSGIRLRQGSSAGRLLAAAHHIRADTAGRYFAHVIFSDDGGATWRRGGTVAGPGGNEGEVAELADGSLLLNARSYAQPQKYRQIARSTDGGLSWSEPQADSALIEPVCQGSLHFLPGPGILLFSNPADTLARRRLTVRASRDGGRSWPDSLVLHTGPAAYSDLVDLPEAEVGILYECGEIWPYEAIVFRKFILSDLVPAREPAIPGR